MTVVLFVACGAIGFSRTRVYNMYDMGVRPGDSVDCSPRMEAALRTIAAETAGRHDRVTLVFGAGDYHFHSEQAPKRELYISNHDQTNPKAVGLALEDLCGLTLEGNGARFVFHGRMLPLALLRSENCTLKDFSIDFVNSHIAQVEIIANEGEGGITFRPSAEVKWRITSDGCWETYGDGWAHRPQSGIAFDRDTRRLVYRTSDLSCPTQGVREMGDGQLHAPAWRDARLIPGTVVAMRSWGRPTPGIFLSHCTNTRIERVRVHYSEGMGLLAQLCTDITLKGFGVCLREGSGRYFTTQADATHFSGCRGRITSVDGLYEGMMDDAINVHGTYLKVVRRLDDRTLVARYMHGQAWGFDWGFRGDRVQFIRSATMEIVGEENRIRSIRPEDRETVDGAREFLIEFERSVDEAVTADEGFGIENLTWTPEVYFARNIVRHNRARGSLFSTPRRTVVEDNLFDHTSGSAILLCGDCNGWYETGACRNVIIRRNRFVNALTNEFQFTNAVISIYPEIPQLDRQELYFHGGKRRAIRIEDNTFETFDIPLLYAKSVDGLLFRRNRVVRNCDYKPFHWNKEAVRLERVTRAEILPWEEDKDEPDR
ncbi:MAG: hypothetical protein NC388_06965 [Clostridium sp.]|nr:hypothetical protein [Clostridium sp.]